MCTAHRRTQLEQILNICEEEIIVQENFFRNVTEQEKRMIEASEELLYRRQQRSFLLLALIGVMSVGAAILSRFVRIGIGTVLCILMIIIGILLLAMIAFSMKITHRQLQKVRTCDYQVQDVVITDVHNEIHGLRSNQYVTFTSPAGENYVMNTETTGDASFIKGKCGLLIILNGEKNILLTCKYRFVPISCRSFQKGIQERVERV